MSKVVTVTAVDDNVMHQATYYGSIAFTFSSDDSNFNQFQEPNVTISIEDNDRSKSIDSFRFVHVLTATLGWSFCLSYLYF